MTVAMKEMYNSSSYQPLDVHKIFHAVDTENFQDVKFNIGPIVFNVPERAGRGHQLYIVVAGWIVFDGADVHAAPLKTKSFGTETGYFRMKAGRLDHVFGSHYDLDETLPGHPVFHAQLANKLDMARIVNDLFHLGAEVDCSFQPLLRNVRIPSAQMDVFSTIVQICGDHLVYKGAGKTVLDAFESMMATSAFLVGAARRLGYLHDAAAANCYRAHHWYGGQIRFEVDAVGAG